MKKLTLHHDWAVTPGDGSSLASLFMSGVQPKPVTLPHDLLVEQPRNP